MFRPHLMRYRIYFNREADWPQVWSVDEGSQDTEINVLGVRIEDGAMARTRELPREARGVATASPSAWIEVDATLRVEAGIAIFTVW